MSTLNKNQQGNSGHKETVRRATETAKSKAAREAKLAELKARIQKTS